MLVSAAALRQPRPLTASASANLYPPPPTASTHRHPHAQWPTACLIELSASSASACLSAIAAMFVETQFHGEQAAWVQPEGGGLFPPDLHASGVDLQALVVIHVPRRLDKHAKAAELLLRSGAFGAVVIDLSELPDVFETRWQQRLLGLVREHHCRVILITRKASQAPSLGPLVTLRLQPERQRIAPGLFAVHHHMLKNKSGHPIPPDTLRRGPWGLE